MTPPLWTKAASELVGSHQLAVVANAFSDFLAEATAWLEDFSAQGYFVLIIALVAYLDAIVPIVPGETLVIVGGVAAGVGDQSLLLVILAGALGAGFGDATAYLIGARLNGFVERRAQRSPRLARRLEWGRQQIAYRGGPLLITARFIPGGRTALTVSCGITHQRFRWFISWVAVAVTIWASYAAVLGYLFGERFNHSVALVLAIGTAIVFNLAIELVRHLRHRYR